MIRSANVFDTPRLLEIYEYYVKNTAISFEITPPTAEEFGARIENTLKKFPYLVIEEEGKIAGYAYAGPFKTREAYSRSCELSVYLDKDCKGKGYGRALYTEITRILKGKGITNLYACIATPTVEDEYLNFGSQKFHARMGFTKVGEFHSCACKFGRPYNMIWMEKIIG